VGAVAVSAALINNTAGMPADNESETEMSAYDDLGDELGALEIGARNPFRRSRKRRGARRGGWLPKTAGVPRRGVHMQPLGLGSTAFTAASGTILALTGTPQRPFRGQRLTLDITRTGATSTGLVTVTRLDVGSDNQLVSAQSLIAAAYSPTAIDNNVLFDVAVPGIIVTVTLAISVAPGGADRVDVGGQINGTALS